MPNPFFDTPRVRRLKRDFEEMKVLKDQSSILEFDADGPAPDRYILRFNGEGLGSNDKIVDAHRLTMSLGMDYPMRQPNVHWETSIHHPNISGGNPCFGTFVMNPNVRLVDIVEILWDMARLALYNPYGGYGEKDTWQVLRKKYDFPIDKRILRDKAPAPPPKAEEDEGEAELIIMSGKKGGLPPSQQWVKQAIWQYMDSRELGEHVAMFTADEWYKQSHEASGGVATMVIDSSLRNSLLSGSIESQEFMDDFMTFLGKLGLWLEEEIPGRIHFYAR